MLQRAGRDDDYLEIGLDSGICYNPLHNDLDPYAVAYAIATLLNNLFGKSKEPFWQQAYTDLLKFVILLRRITDGYTTFSEVYRYILEDGQIDQDIRRLKAATRTSRPTSLRIREGRLSRRTARRRRGGTGSIEDDAPHGASVPGRPREPSSTARHVRLRRAEDAEHGVDRPQAATRGRRALVRARLEQARRAPPVVDRRRRRRVPVAVRRQPRGASHVLSARGVPTPGSPRRASPRPLPPLADLLESGKVLALNFPVGLNPGLARILGVMLKLDFQRAVLQRIPQISGAARRARGATCCSSATSTTPSPRWARPTRPATSARSRCRARRG